jgi:Holliday junction resolvase
MKKPVARESKVEKEIREYAEATGWWVTKFTSPGRKGVPDRIFIQKGIVTFIEIKRPGEEPTPQQELRIQEMKKHGALVCWVDSFAKAKEWLDFLR